MSRRRRSFQIVENLRAVLRAVAVVIRTGLRGVAVVAFQKDVSKDVVVLDQWDGGRVTDQMIVCGVAVVVPSESTF